MGLIKSHSNYVLQKKHQLLNDGTIFERDYNTLGGIGNMPSSPKNLYKNGTFVYQIQNKGEQTIFFKPSEWENGGNYITQEEIGNISETSNKVDINFKQHTYKLKDFAYYGSCVELVRSSINNIIEEFPGELYFTNKIAKDIDGTEIKSGDTKFFMIDNPFNIDIHTTNLSTEESQHLRYIHGDLNRYEVRFGTSSKTSLKTITIEKIENKDCYGFISQIVISYGMGQMTLYLYKLQNEKYVYVHKMTLLAALKTHICPKDNFYKAFINNLDSFQKVLLNLNSQPKYSATLEVLKETEYGYQNVYEKLTFPTSDGDYNLDISSMRFKEYINALSNYAELLDNVYCNNLYRQMTHESIKNFDWTDTLQRDEETREDYLESGDKIQKLLHICGREMDEIKFYIDGIRNSNNITYGDADNLPNYLLTDTLNIEGWDVRNIFPYEYNNDKWVENTSANTKVYSAETPYYRGWYKTEENCLQFGKISTSISADTTYIDDNDILRYKIYSYSSDKEYSMEEMNNKFMKMLKLSSRHILQRKGTIDGIEMLLSLFGLRSKRMDNGKYDYEINEYVAITSGITDEKIDTYNQHKTVVYDTQEYRNNIYVPYQGLPVRPYVSGNTTYLFPYFSKNKIIDGNPYYQMYGGWLNKEYSWNGNAYIISGTNYTDTLTQIPLVNDLKELVLLDDEKLYNNIVYYVKNIQDNQIFIEGQMYEILSGDNNTYYFTVTVNNHQIKVGKKQWGGVINIYSLGENNKISVNDVNLNEYTNGKILKIYLKDKKYLHFTQNDSIITNYQIIEKDDTQVSDETNYYQLYNVEWKEHIGGLGWNRLRESDKEYKIINNIKRKYNGNNPHKNGLIYDEGVEYLKYFEKLFKYAIENDEFNPNCFANYNEDITEIAQIGFNGLINSENSCETIKKHQDTKINYFCDIIDNNNEIKKFCEIDKINDGYTLSDKTEYSGTITSNVTCLDQIINLKNVDITFYVNSNNTEYIKYIDEVVLSYLTQMIPSNVILNIKINEKG